MATKNMTIVFVPGGKLKVRQIGFPRFLMVVLILLFLSGALVLTWAGRDYWTIKKQIPQLTTLQKENKLQKDQLIILTQKIDQIGKRSESGSLKSFRDGQEARQKLHSS